MSTDTTQPTSKPCSDERTANRFAFAALALAAVFTGYYGQTLVGVYPAPPVGLVPLFVGSIMLCATVKICHWAVDRRVRQVEAHHAAELEELRKLVTALQELTATVLNDGDQQTRQALAHSQRLLGGSVNGATVTHLPASRPSS